MYLLGRQNLGGLNFSGMKEQISQNISCSMFLWTTKVRKYLLQLWNNRNLIHLAVNRGINDVIITGVFLTLTYESIHLQKKFNPYTGSAVAQW